MADTLKPVDEDMTGWIPTGILMIMVAGVIYTLFYPSLMQSQGATRSANLEWKQRQAEIREVIQKEDLDIQLRDEDERSQ